MHQPSNDSPNESIDPVVGSQIGTKNRISLWTDGKDNRSWRNRSGKDESAGNRDQQWRRHSCNLVCIFLSYSSWSVTLFRSYTFPAAAFLTQITVKCTASASRNFLAATPFGLFSGLPWNWDPYFWKSSALLCRPYGCLRRSVVP